MYKINLKNTISQIANSLVHINCKTKYKTSAKALVNK